MAHGNRTWETFPSMKRHKLTKTERFLTLFQETAAPIFRRHFTADSCINSTRVTLDVFEAMGYDGGALEPLAVTALAVNRAFVDRVERDGRLPRDQMETQQWFEESGAHSLGVGFGKQEADHKWPGHLIVGYKRWLIDPSARQMRRPQHGMHVPDIFVGEMADDFRTCGEYRHYDMPDGTRILYKCRPRDFSYAVASGFQQHERNVRVARDIIAALKRRR